MTRIFSLMILFSSIFIYNSVGSIDENAINNLSRDKPDQTHPFEFWWWSQKIDSEEYGKFFPTFIWIIRDFTLKLVDPEGKLITSQQYLERTLAIQEGFFDDIEKKNRIRRLFKIVSVWLDPWPMKRTSKTSKPWTCIKKLRPDV